MSIRQEPFNHKTSIFKTVLGFALMMFLLLCQTNETGGLKTYAFRESDSINLGNPLSLCWHYKISGEYKAASDNTNELYLFGHQNLFSQVIANNGSINWQFQIGGQIISEPIIYKEEIIYLIRIINDLKYTDSVKTDERNLGEYIIRSTNRITGITKWQIKIPLTDLHGTVYAYVFESSFVIVSGTGNLIIVNIPEVEITRKKSIDINPNVRPFFGSSKFYIAGRDNKVRAMSYSDLTVKHEFIINSTPTSIVVTSDLFIWGDRKGYVNALMPSKVDRIIRWRSRKGGEILSLTRTAIGILVASSDNYIYLISERDGNTIWKKRLASRIMFEPLILENFIVLSTVGESAASILNLDDGRMVNQVLLSDANLFTAAPRLSEKVIVFQTLEGLAAYSNTPCPQVKQKPELGI